MSFRSRGGRGRGGGRGWREGRGGGRGRGRGGRFQYYDPGPPETVVELGSYVHPCEGDLVCKGTNEKIPYFNAPIFLENKAKIGKVDEIFGAIQDYYFSVKLLPDMQASSFNQTQKFYTDPMKLLPLARFLPRPKTANRGRARGFTPRGEYRGRGRGTPRGRFTPRGGFRGGGFRGGGFRGGRGGGRGGRGRGFRGARF